MTARQKLALERKIAKILAMRYWDGAHDRHAVKEMSFEKYWNLSGIEWIGAASGIVHLVKKQIENAR